MKNLLNKGKVIVSCISVLAILAVSLLSIFSGGSVISTAADNSTVTYPINGSYDADVVIQDGGITYTDIDTATKTEVSDFTAFDTTFWLTADGDGTAANPFIVKTANQFAAVATNNLVYDAAVNPDFNINKYNLTTVDSEKVLNTAGVYFKVADNVKAFNMNNTDSTVDFSATMTAAEVKTALSSANFKKDGNNKTLTWSAKTHFKGVVNGNGVVVYGLYGKTSSVTALFPEVEGVTIRNLTVKNCYFTADKAGVMVGQNHSDGNVTIQSCAIYNNAIEVTRLNQGTSSGGIVLGSVSTDNSAVLVYDSLVCDNLARHSETVSKHSGVYDINYALFNKSQSKDGATVSNSIVIGAAPYCMIHSYNTFHMSTYDKVYTDMLGSKVENIDWTSDGAQKYIVSSTLTANAEGGYSHLFEYSTGGVAGEPYTRNYDAGAFYKVTAADAKGSNVKSAMPNLDWSKWTVNADGYPVPKLYSIREYSAGVAWTGEVALFLSGGGTASAPYIVSTAEEFVLMLTTAKAGEYYALSSDIVLNDTTSANWTDNAKQWFTSNDVPAFEGTLDGMGYSVSGLYYSGNQAGESAGLIPVLGSGATIKNLTIKDSVLNGRSNANLAAVSGSVGDMCSKVINISSVTVEDTVEFNGDAKIAGIISSIGYSAVRINDCISKSAGFINTVTGQATVKRSVSVDAYPFVTTDFIKAEGVYTNTDGLEVDGVTVLASNDMKGDAAATNMTALDFTVTWGTQAGDYPLPTGAETSSDGVKGDVWSGAIATNFAGGDGSENNPWLIETGEQLALCVYNTVPEKYYKLTADIYLNDVDSNLWQDKVGCTEWLSQWDIIDGGKSIRDVTFDGDGYVVHGIYLNSNNATNYYRGGLFPYITKGTHIKNVGVSNAYILGNDEYSDVFGGIAANMSNWLCATDANGNYVYPEVIDLIISYVGQSAWDSEYIGKWGATMPTHDANATKAILANPLVAPMVPVIENCFVDHNSYISGKTAGGILGHISSPVTIKNCVVTASVNGTTIGAFIGNDASYSSVFEGSLALTQTCLVPADGVSHSDWRSTPAYRCSQAINSYYFAVQRATNTDFVKISKPENRVGDAAKEFMTGLDWAGDDEDGTEDVWMVIPDGTPLQTIFSKHHTTEQYEKYSNKEFTPPEVTVSFATGTDEIELEPIKGAMYDKMKLPDLSNTRAGYKFTGWYVFDDLSVEYPYDYYPPRDLTLVAGWEALGVIQTFEEYTDTLWDYNEDCWVLNKPGASGGYNNNYVRSGSKSMHLLDTNTSAVDCLLNYEDMLVPGTAYTMTFWVATDKADNPATLISLVHNSKPDYLDTGIAIENMAVVTGLTVGEWTQYTYSFTAKTNWVSLRASGNSSLWFDDIVIASLDGVLSDGTVSYLSNYTANNGGLLSPKTGDSVTVAVLISAIVACAVIVVVSRKNLVETIDD